MRFRHDRLDILHNELARNEIRIGAANTTVDRLKYEASKRGQRNRQPLGMRDKRQVLQNSVATQPNQFLVAELLRFQQIRHAPIFVAKPLDFAIQTVQQSAIDLETLHEHIQRNQMRVSEVHILAIQIRDDMIKLFKQHQWQLELHANALRIGGTFLNAQIRATRAMQYVFFVYQIIFDIGLVRLLVFMHDLEHQVPLLSGLFRRHKEPFVGLVDTDTRNLARQMTKHRTTHKLAIQIYLFDILRLA
mmetsp:Transcript_46112/g.76734  ORF Transcript_46112/g.76734 Transcript_46112/m.76734 type:complete len:247 (-) Transcript_46112:583-1323(-)